MKKIWFIGLLLTLTACNEANEIFEDGEYEGDSSLNNEIIVMENGYERYYEGPVYIDVSNWGAVAYIGDKYVNKGIKLLISEANNAEGGKVIDVTSNTIVITGLELMTQYYYCLVMPNGEFKSEIKSMVMPDMSALEMYIECERDSVICTILDSINSVFIVDKGFRLINADVKCEVKGSRFALSISDLRNKYHVGGSISIYAYVQTSNAYYRTEEIIFGVGGNVNVVDVEISEISEETLDNVDFLKCTVVGYVDSAYFNRGGYDEVANRIYPDKVVSNEDGTMNTFYVKKGFYEDLYLRAYYKRIYGEDSLIYWNENITSCSYTPTHFNIRSLENLLEFVSWNRYRGYGGGYMVSLLTDITVPSDTRLCIDLDDLTIEGNGHTLDGISYFPLFRGFINSSVKNLKIGTDNTVYHVKKGTNSLSTTSNEVPCYFLSENYDVPNHVFENSEVRGTFKISGKNDFYLTYGYNEDQVVRTGDGYIERIPGLRDYTKTEYVK